MKSLRELVEYGADIEFKIYGKEYTILPWIDDGIVIGIKDSEEDSIYQTYDDMVNNFAIDGKAMKDILEDIDITFTSGCE